MARGEGSSRLLLIVLVALLAGGAYNYHRNYQAESAVPRPYKGYSDADLQALLDAYEREKGALERSYEAARSLGGKRTSGGMLDENIQAFEAAQRRSSGSRSLGARLSMQQAAAGQIQEELQIREGERDPMQVHMRRLLTL